MISGKTKLIAHIGYPTETFKAPLILNPWFESQGIDAVVMPMGVKAEDYVPALTSIRKFTNFHGALVTMPHKITTVGLVDEATTAVKIAGSSNALLKLPDGRLKGDNFDGAGFVRGVMRKGLKLAGASCLIVGTGGVGSAIAASVAAESPAEMTLFDVSASSAEALAGRLRQHYPKIDVRVGSNDPAGYTMVVNASPLGMNADDPLPFDVSRLSADIFVAEVVMKIAMTPLLKAAQAKGCQYTLGTDMLFEQIPAYLEFFGFGTATPEQLRAVAKISY